MRTWQDAWTALTSRCERRSKGEGVGRWQRAQSYWAITCPILYHLPKPLLRNRTVFESKIHALAEANSSLLQGRRTLIHSLTPHKAPIGWLVATLSIIAFFR